MENIILSSISKDELISEIANKVFLKIVEISPIRTDSQSDLIKPAETAALLKVSLVTINQWTKEGKLTAYRIGRRKFYKQDEVLKALESTGKYRRVKC